VSSTALLRLTSTVTSMADLWSTIIDWLTAERISVITGVGFGLVGSIFGWRGFVQQRRANSAAEQATRESLEPMVVVSVAASDNDRDAMVLTIENAGPSIARNVRITVDQPPVRSFDKPGEPQMYEWHVFTDGISSMPPRSRLVFLFDIGSRRFNSDLPTQYTFTVDADGPWGSVATLVYDVDLRPMRDAWAGQTTIKNVVEKLTAMNEALGSLTDAVRKLDQVKSVSVADIFLRQLFDETRRLGIDGVAADSESHVNQGHAGSMKKVEIRPVAQASPGGPCPTGPGRPPNDLNQLGTHELPAGESG
jgi:hypothetical protein